MSCEAESQEDAGHDSLPHDGAHAHAHARYRLAFGNERNELIRSKTSLRRLLVWYTQEHCKASRSLGIAAVHAVLIVREQGVEVEVRVDDFDWKDETRGQEEDGN